MNFSLIIIIFLHFYRGTRRSRLGPITYPMDDDEAFQKSKPTSSTLASTSSSLSNQNGDNNSGGSRFSSSNHQSQNSSGFGYNSRSFEEDVGSRSAVNNNKSEGSVQSYLKGEEPPERLPPTKGKDGHKMWSWVRQLFNS